MTRKRLSADEKAIRADRLERIAWERFSNALERASGIAEACEVAHHQHPGAQWHSNLAYFLRDFTVPHGARDDEKALYLALIRRANARGELKPGVAERLESALAPVARSGIGAPQPR